MTRLTLHELDDRKLRPCLPCNRLGHYWLGTRLVVCDYCNGVGNVVVGPSERLPEVTERQWLEWARMVEAMS